MLYDQFGNELMVKVSGEPFYRELSLEPTKTTEVFRTNIIPVAQVAGNKENRRMSTQNLLGTGGTALDSMKQSGQKAVLLMAHQMSPICQPTNAEKYKPEVKPGDWFLTDPDYFHFGEKADIRVNIVSFQKYYARTKGEGDSAITVGQYSVAEYARLKSTFQRNTENKEIDSEGNFIRMVEKFTFYIHPVGEFPGGIYTWNARATALKEATQLITMVSRFCKQVDSSWFISPDVIATRCVKTSVNKKTGKTYTWFGPDFRPLKEITEEDKIMAAIDDIRRSQEIVPEIVSGGLESIEPPF